MVDLSILLLAAESCDVGDKGMTFFRWVVAAAAVLALEEISPALFFAFFGTADKEEVMPSGESINVSMDEGRWFEERAELPVALLALLLGGLL